MSTWTLEHAKAIVAAWPEVETRCSHFSDSIFSGQWNNPSRTLDGYPIRHIGDPNIFRLPPKKKLVEWTASDVKPGMVFRRNGWGGTMWQGFHAVGSKGIYWDQPCREITHWRELIDYGWEWSIDASPGSWRPCAKEVEE